MRPGGESHIAEQLVNTLDFKFPLDYKLFCNQIDSLINVDLKLFEFAFNIFDFNKDGYIDEIDIYCIMKLFDFKG
jgi:hypothetical protein